MITYFVGSMQILGGIFMSRKKKICIVLTAIILLALTGISIIIGMKYWKTNDIRKNAKSTIECIINSDYSKDFYYISMYGQIKNELNMEEVAKTVMSNMKYKLNDIIIKKDDNGNDFAIIKCEFKSIDMIDIIYQLQEDNNDNYSRKYNSLILNKIKNKEYKTKTFNIDIIMLKMDNTWYLYETPDFNNVITGGLYSPATVKENTILNELQKKGK